MKCEECKYWKHIDKNEFDKKPNTVHEVGECKRYPPKDVGMAEYESNFFELSSSQMTDGHDWCGEFEAKDQDEAKNAVS